MKHKNELMNFLTMMLIIGVLLEDATTFIFESISFLQVYIKTDNKGVRNEEEAKRGYSVLKVHLTECLQYLQEREPTI